MADANAIKKSLKASKSGNNLVLTYSANGKVTLNDFFTKGTSVKALLAKKVEEIVKVELENGSSYELKIIDIDTSTDGDDDIKVF